VFPGKAYEPMTISPILIIHVGAGSIGIVSGAAALAVSKGGRLHRAFGTVFLASMLVMSAMGAYLAAVVPQRGTVLVGLFTFYFVATAWMTVKSKRRGTGWFDVGALLVALSAAVTGLIWGFKALHSPAGALDGIPPAPYLIFAAFAAFAASLDLKVILCGGVSGASRISRHLWRMCTALLFAAAFFFIGQQKVMPAYMHGSPFLWLPEIAVLGLMIYWLFRVRLAKRFRDEAIPLVRMQRKIGAEE
jgi:uncharacterized membrane protein